MRNEGEIQHFLESVVMLEERFRPRIAFEDNQEARVLYADFSPAYKRTKETGVCTIDDVVIKEISLYQIMQEDIQSDVERMIEENRVYIVGCLRVYLVFQSNKLKKS